MKFQLKYLFMAVVCLPFLYGCGVTKQCLEPQLDMPETIVAGTEADSLCMADVAWWEIYTDSTLQELIQKTLDNNKDLLSATARVRELERRHRIVRADQFPSLSGQAYWERETNDYANESFIEDIETGIKAVVTWEVDFFGRLRWSNRAALANYLSSVEAQRATQMTLIAEVVTAYFELIALDSELDIVERTLYTRKENAHLALIRFQGGLTSEITYQQAQVELATTASLIPALEKEIRIKENEIALLAGEFPTKIERKPVQLSEQIRTDLQMGLPSDLLRRRPDIRGAEQNLKAAMANAGIAWADRFPRFKIDLIGGVENNEFAGFFASPFTYLAGELVAPVFAFGKRKAQYEAALAAYDNARFQYEEKVLTAFKEANDAFISLSSAQKTVVLMQNLENAAKTYVDLVRSQHINGDINYIDVLDAQRQYFDAEIKVINAELEAHLAFVELYKSLGGGWKQTANTTNESQDEQDREGQTKNKNRNVSK